MFNVPPFRFTVPLEAVASPWLNCRPGMVSVPVPLMLIVALPRMARIRVFVELKAPPLTFSVWVDVGLPKLPMVVLPVLLNVPPV